MNQQKLREAIEANWLIVPKAQAEEDDDSYHSWKSRDIGPQRVVLTEYPDDAFASYDEYRSFELECGVSVPNYLVDKELRREQREGLDTRIVPLDRYVLDDKVNMLYTRHYDHQVGLAFLREPSRSDEEWNDSEPIKTDNSTCI